MWRELDEAVVRRGVSGGWDVAMVCMAHLEHGGRAMGKRGTNGEQRAVGRRGAPSGALSVLGCKRWLWLDLAKERQHFPQGAGSLGC
eukprot:scaffold2349_cov31-Tisochrysis_lutea.AAC.4